jgi:molecular chaperone GrpE
MSNDSTMKTGNPGNQGHSASVDDPPTGPGPDGEETVSPEFLEELKAKAAEFQDKYMRLAADFENYKKRAAREKQDATRNANESLLQKLIGVLDNFDMAVAAAANSEEPAVKSMHTGVNMILAQLRGVLTEAGLEEIEALNRPFDPNFHEAISQQERTDVPEGQVVQQMRKGFKYRDRLLRPASVIVSRRPAS